MTSEKKPNDGLDAILPETPCPSCGATNCWFYSEPEPNDNEVHPYCQKCMFRPDAVPVWPFPGTPCPACSDTNWGRVREPPECSDTWYFYCETCGHQPEGDLAGGLDPREDGVGD